MPIYPYSFTLPPVNKQDIPSDGVAGEFLGINSGGQLDWLPVSGGSGSGDLLAANNLSELTPTAGTARTNLGLGTGDSPTFANLTLTSPSLSSSAPVTISQTWNNAAVAFTGLKVNAAGASGTNSASGSLLADFQVGGSSQFRVHKEGGVALNNLMAIGGISGPWFMVYNGSTPSGYAFAVNVAGRLSLPNTGTLEWASYASGTPNTVLLRDGADNTLALRNGTAAQTFNVYGTWSSITDYRRLTVSVDNTTGNATITANKGSATTGDVGTVSINGVPVGLGKGNVSSNVAVGTGALSTNTTGSDNVAVGFETLGLGTTGSESVAVGWRAAKGSSVRHVSIGYGANQLGATDSVSIGWASMFELAGGSLNVSIGRNGGRFITGGSTSLTSCTKSLFLGCDTKALGQSQENQIVIGYDATGIGSNSVVLGNDSITKTALKGNVGIGTTSPSSKLHVAGDVTLPNGGSIFFGGGYNIYGTTTATTINGPTAFGQVAVAVNGATKWVFNYDGLLCGGGTTAAFPALKRSSTTVQARLADDTAFAPIQGKLTTDTAYTGTVVAATGYITIYDSTGAAYRVPCAV